MDLVCIFASVSPECSRYGSLRHFICFCDELFLPLQRYFNISMQREFEVIFKSYFVPVKSFIRKLVKTDDDAEDIAQDVFTQLWLRPEVWKDNAEVGRYIYRMAKYRALTFLRDNARIADHGLVDADLAQVERVGDDTSAIDPIIHEETTLLLQMALDRMPPKRREIFSMSRFEGLSHKEIAQKLGLSVRTVESHIYAALTALKLVFPRYSGAVSLPVIAAMGLLATMPVS